MKRILVSLFILPVLSGCTSSKMTNVAWNDNIRVILDNTRPLRYSRDNRLPLYLWPAIDPGQLSPGEAELLVKEMDRRGVGLISSWAIKDSSKMTAQALNLARAQKKLGQRVNIEASDLMYSFFDGDSSTAHIDENGKPFFDDSFGDHKMGCPFTLNSRKEIIRKRFERFLKLYSNEDIPVDFIFTDWETDGPLEWNGAFEASKKCKRCTEILGKDFTFETFQQTMRSMRSYLQNYSYSEPVLDQFPGALAGNYAVYPNDGYRYWYDYYEYYTEGQPFKSDQGAKYRKWCNDFPGTGFTYAMPVSYNWSPSYAWYNFDNSDYRWFYNMLLVASNAGKNTPPGIPVVSFVHWHTVFVTGKPDFTIKQMSKESYQELLWHMLLRGTDTFFLWAEKEEFPEEVRLLQEVYADAQQYGRFLDRGLPITFTVSTSPGTVISGLALNDSVLIRRTDFSDNHGPVKILAGTKVISVDYTPGVCKIISLN